MILKKNWIKVSIIILIVVALGGCAFGAYVGGRVWTNTLESQHEYSTIYSFDTIGIEKSDSAIFSVLKINDTHLFNGQTENDIKTIVGLENILEKESVDFVVLAGDIVDGFNLNPNYDKEKALCAICDVVDEAGVPWTFVPGNNDGEIDGSNKDVIAYLLKYENFVTGNIKGLYGDTQFYVDLLYNGTLVHSLAFMDSGMRKPKVTGKYDHFKENQVENLVETVRRKGVLTSVFFHMQTPAFEQAYHQGEQYENMPIRYSENYDRILKNDIFDEMTKGEELIGLLSVGHQHGNSLCSFYSGRYYELSSPSGYSAWMPSGTWPSVTLTEINALASSVKDAYKFEKIAL